MAYKDVFFSSLLPQPEQKNTTLKKPGQISLNCLVRVLSRLFSIIVLKVAYLYQNYEASFGPCVFSINDLKTLFLLLKVAYLYQNYEASFSPCVFQSMIIKLYSYYGRVIKTEVYSTHGFHQSIYNYEIILYMLS